MELFRTVELQYLDISYSDIAINENEITFITGCSGCGKSSLLKLLNITAIPSFGSVLYRGSFISEYSPIDYRKNVLLASQDFFLFDKSIRENFRLYYDARDESCPDDDYILEILGICCIDFEVDTPCHTMSGGERQRVFLAICLSFKPNAI